MVHWGAKGIRFYIFLLLQFSNGDLIAWNSSNQTIFIYMHYLVLNDSTNIITYSKRVMSANIIAGDINLWQRVRVTRLMI